MTMRRDDPRNQSSAKSDETRRAESRREESRPVESGGEEDVRRLIRTAGRRPAPPAADLAAITAVARSAWREKTAAASRTAAGGERAGSESPADRSGRAGDAVERLTATRVARFEPAEPVPAGGARTSRSTSFARSLALAASLALAVLAGWWWIRTADEPVVGGRVASVELVRGAATADGSPLFVGSDLAAGVDVATPEGAEASRLSLRMVGGQSLRIDGGTLVHLSSADSVELRRGALYVDSPPGEGLRAIDVVTPLGTVVEIGTQFEVRYDDRAGELEVRVREGAVSVRNDGQAATARRGESLAVRRDGSVSRSEAPVHGESWEWVLDMAPAIEIEGRSLQDFLDWVERETAQEVAFGDGGLAADAETIVLHGTLDGLRPDEAMDVILRGAGLRASVEGDRVIVSRAR